MPIPIYPEKPEQDVITRLQQGHQEALGLLYDKFAPILLGLISRIVPDKHNAEAILAEAFLTIWHRKAAYDPAKTGLLTWMITIARETAIKGIKAGKYQHDHTAMQAPTMLHPDEEAGSAKAFEGRINDFCSRLSPAEKAALDLIYLEGYTCSEAAAALNIPEVDFKNNLQLAIKHLGAEKVA